MRLPRWLVVPAVLQLVLAVVLCFTPLFDLLGYEFSLATGLLAVPNSLVIGLGAARQPTTGLRALGRGVLLALAHLAAPLLVNSLNALRVQNCDYWEGLGFFILLPVCSAAYSAGLGVTVGQLLAPARRSRRLVTAILVAGAPLLATLWQLYSQPPVFAYDHLWGHFAGSLYDEAVGLTDTLLVFRLGTLLRLAGLVALVAMWDRRTGRGARPTLVAALVALLVAAWFDAEVGSRYGFRVTRADIERELPLVETRPGLVIHFPASASAEARQALADEHAFRLAQLTERLGAKPAGVIHSYVYADASQKARLMGGRATMIAKPWLSEIHIHEVTTPHPVLAHELAHVVAAEFGAPPLKVSAQYGLWVNMTVVEGLAEAVSTEDSALDLDHTARALTDLHLTPDLRQLMGPAGFWTQAPRRAYAVAGSFIRFLLTSRGTPPLQRCYRDGDFATAYGEPLDALVRAWEQVIAGVTLSDAELRVARDFLRTPSIFARPCAHEIATLRAEAGRANPAQAVEVQRRIVEHLGGSPDARLDLALALSRAQLNEEFFNVSEELLADSRLNDVQRGRLLEARGDVHWQDNHLDLAAADWQRILDLGVNPNAERLHWVKLWALRQPPALRDTLRGFLRNDVPQLVAVLALIEGGTPGDPTVSYLVGRQLYNTRAYQPALSYLERAPHPFALIETERLRLVADCLWRLNRLDEAASAFRTYAGHALFSGERARATDMLEWIDWQRANAAPK